jgi:chromosome segregation ATPase
MAIALNPLAGVLQQMDAVNVQLQQLEDDKKQKLQEELQRKQLLEALDDPQTRHALRAQLELAANQIDALALQLDAQRQVVSDARAKVQKALDAIDDAPSLSHVLASRLSAATARAAPAFRAAGLAAVATPVGAADAAKPAKPKKPPR